MGPHEIETARLHLRPVTEADVDELHALWSSPEVRKYLWDDEVIAREQTASLVEESVHLFAAYGYGLWGARLRDLVHLQDRFRVASYSKHHENSNLCTFVLRRGA